MEKILIALLFIPFLANAQSDDEGELFFSNHQKLEVSVGHKSADCDGKGEPTIAFDMIIDGHLPCQGFGSECTYNFTAEIILIDTDVEDVVRSNNKSDVRMYFGVAFNEDEFRFPARSIFCNSYNRYMNIPYGAIEKESNETGDYYKALGVTFSDKPLFTNK